MGVFTYRGSVLSQVGAASEMKDCSTVLESSNGGQRTCFQSQGVKLVIVIFE